MNDSKYKKERLLWIDVLKCIGIWAVYIGHFGNSAGRGYGFAYLFQNALFFMCAGFFHPHTMNSLMGRGGGM